MPPRKATPATTPEPVLETFHTVSDAAVRLGLRKPDDTTGKGEKWLRDGVNKQGWPCHRMARQLLFSDSDLAAIAELHRNRQDARSRPRPSTGRRTRRARVAPTT